jgi:predicted PurR-regulated permease PerM
MFPARARVAEWQTQRTQNPPGATPCEFDSRLGHSAPFLRGPGAPASTGGAEVRTDPMPDSTQHVPSAPPIPQAIRPRPAPAVQGLFVLALGYTLYFTHALLLPIVAAILLTFLLSPAIRGLRRLRLPEPVGALVVLVAFLGMSGAVIYELAGPADDWIRGAPRTLAQVDARLRTLAAPLLRFKRTADYVEQATTLPDATKVPEVTVRAPELSTRLFGTTRILLRGIVETILLLYFLLASGDRLLQKVVNSLPSLADKKKAVAIARETEQAIATYLGTVTLINLAVGLLIAGATWAIGLPNPLLWGALAAVLEFVPYLGSAVMIGLLTVAGLATFETTGHAILAPITYFAIAALQANIVTPLVLGRRLTLNPVVIVVGLTFWWGVWGLPGLFLAVPLLATFKIFCDHIESLAPVGELLGG